MYVIHTSDGGIHSTSDPQTAAAILDRYGAEVVSYSTVDEPSAAQVKAFDEFIELHKTADATLTGFMDQDGDGTMLISVAEDGLTQHARFNRDGRMMGSWF